MWDKIKKEPISSVFLVLWACAMGYFVYSIYLNVKKTQEERVAVAEFHRINRKYEVVTIAFKRQVIRLRRNMNDAGFDK